LASHPKDGVAKESCDHRKSMLLGQLARLDRAASTVSREVARHGGRPEYRANEADYETWESALRPERRLLAIHGKFAEISLRVN